MKNKLLSIGLLAVIMGLLLLACKQKMEETTSNIDTVQIKTEIQAIENHFANTYNKGNIDSLDYYADDAASYFNNELPIVGKEAIHKFIKEGIENFPQGAKLSYVTNEIHVSSDGKQVLEIGAFTLIDSTNTKIRSGKYFSLFEKRNGKYVCIRDMGNADPTDE
jgi:ketosteroid isomerase-like protein